MNNISNHPSSFFNPIVAFVKSKVLDHLNEQQKRILGIACVALSFLVACYAIARCCCFKAKPQNKDKSEIHGNGADKISDNLDASEAVPHEGDHKKIDENEEDGIFDEKDDLVDDNKAEGKVPANADDQKIEVKIPLKVDAKDKQPVMSDTDLLISDMVGNIERWKGSQLNYSEISKAIFTLKCQQSNIARSVIQVIQTDGPALRTLDLTLFENISEFDIQEVVKHCPNIEKIVLKRSQIGLASFKELKTLASLKSLELIECADVVDICFAQLKDCPSLQSLILHDCQNFTREGLKHLASIASLTTLELIGCVDVNDTYLEQIKDFPSLHTLKLQKCRNITNKGLKDLASLASLTSLELIKCDFVNNDTLALLKDFPALKSLNLHLCLNFTHEGLKHLASLATLRSLNLMQTCYQQPWKGLPHLAKLTSLESLNLRGCDYHQDDDLVHIKNLTALRSLNLSWLMNITDAGVKKYLKKLSSLESLELAETQITDEILEFLKNFPSLKILDLERCHLITDAGLEHLKALPSLVYLKLRGCRKITDVGIAHLQHLPALAYLDISRSQVSDVGMSYLQQISTLMRLYLRECMKITDKGFALIEKTKFPKLEDLELIGCQITQPEFDKIKAAFPALSIHI